MKLANDFRKIGITMKKRFNLFKYNLNLKKEIGMYDPSAEHSMLEGTVRSLNLFDFSAGK